MIAELIRKSDPVAIVETGTYLGTSTEWLTGFQVPIFSCEASVQNYGYSRARLGGHPGVHLIHGDSRSALESVLDGPLKNSLAEPILLYLDAHWNEDLPLAEEIELIFSRCPSAVAVIDDFKVEDDAGYSYDDYGPGKALIADYVAPAIDKHGLTLFYPSTPSARETGAKRGCSVLVGPAIVARVAEVDLLRPASA